MGNTLTSHAIQSINGQSPFDASSTASPQESRILESLSDQTTLQDCVRQDKQKCLSWFIEGHDILIGGRYLIYISARMSLHLFVSVDLHSHLYVNTQGTAVAQWLRCCATNRKVAGTIPDGVIGIFHRHNPSDRTMNLGSTQPLTEMSTRRISWG